MRQATIRGLLLLLTLSPGCAVELLAVRPGERFELRLKPSPDPAEIPTVANAAH